MLCGVNYVLAMGADYAEACKKMITILMMMMTMMVMVMMIMTIFLNKESFPVFFNEN